MMLYVLVFVGLGRVTPHVYCIDSMYLTSLPGCSSSGCACVGGPGGELCAAAGGAECFCGGDAGAALPAAPLLPLLLHGRPPLLQVGAGPVLLQTSQQLT